MGDMRRFVKIAPMHGESAGRAHRFKVLVDTGATSTIISEKVAKKIKAEVRRGTGLRSLDDDADVPWTLIAVQAGGGCETRVLVAIVSDEHAAKAGSGTAAILGHDYLQQARAVLRYDVKKHKLVCPTKKPKR